MFSVCLTTVGRDTPHREFVDYVPDPDPDSHAASSVTRTKMTKTKNEERKLSLFYDIRRRINFKNSAKIVEPGEGSV